MKVDYLCVHKFYERNFSWYVENYKGECGMNAWG